MPIITIQREQVISQDEKTIAIDLPETLLSERKLLDYSKVEAEAYSGKKPIRCLPT